MSEFMDIISEIRSPVKLVWNLKTLWVVVCTSEAIFTAVIGIAPCSALSTQYSVLAPCWPLGSRAV